MYTDDVWGRSGPDAVVNITEPVKSKRLHWVDEIKRAARGRGDDSLPLPDPAHHGIAGEEFDERKVDSAFATLEEISLFARQRGVEVLLENTPNGPVEARSVSAVLFLRLTHMNLNICFDLGHANMNEGVETAYRLLAPRIRSTHIHDNNGSEDSHLFPLLAEDGSIDWKRAMSALRSTPDQYPLLLELKEVPNMEKPLDRVRETFDKLENLKSDNES